MARAEKSNLNVKRVAPDGGWGWIVVLGCSLINLSTRSIEPSFGLLFGDFLKDLGVATTGAAIIVSALDATINFSGLLVGPLIKKFSYRKVAWLGATLSGLALVATSFASSMTHVFLCYSLLGGLGFGLSTAATFVALNSYFDQRRGQAVGLAMAGTALGFMAMPQIISRLLEQYAFKGTMFILGAISFNAMVGASVLQPVKHHLKSVVIEEEKLLNEKEDSYQLSEKDGSHSTSLLGLPRNTSVASSIALHRQNSQSCSSVSRQPSMMPGYGSRRRKASTISNVSHLDLMGSTLHVHLETDSEDEDNNKQTSLKSIHIENGLTKSNNNIIYRPTSVAVTKKRRNDSIWRKFTDMMDLELLLDIKYLNILFGISITYIAELNFKLIIPFFMANMGYSKRETAQALSVMAMADITARIVIPPIYDRLSFSRRNTLMIGLVCVAVARSILAEQTEWTNLMVALVVHGFFRGFALINFPLVISEAVVPEKFPAALGLSMVSKGLFIVVLGPVSGWIRDYSGSYPLCLHAQSLMLMSCVLAWSAENIFTRKVQPEVSHTTEPS